MVILSIALLLFVFSYPSFISYKIVNPRSDWYLYSWTGHATLFAGVALLFIYFGVNVPSFEVFSFLSIFIAGAGLIVLSGAYLLEHFHMRKDEYMKWYVVLPIHAGFVILAVVFLSRIALSFQDLMACYVLCTAYFLLMYRRLDSPWILYRDSRFPIEKREALIHAGLFIIYFLVPLLLFRY
jgi:hypothetical protein